MSGRIMDISKIVLKDCLDESPTPKQVNVSVGIERDGLALLIKPERYGDYCSVEGEGTPILLELFDNELRLVIWADINQEEPTHIISLEGARELRRITEDDENEE